MRPPESSHRRGIQSFSNASCSLSLQFREDIDALHATCDDGTVPFARSGYYRCAGAEDYGGFVLDKSARSDSPRRTIRTQTKIREGLRDVLVRLYSQDLTVREYKTAGGAIYGLVAAVLLRVNFEGGMTKDLRATLAEECAADGIPAGTVKPVMAAVRRLATFYPLELGPRDDLTAAHLELVDLLRSDFPTAMGLLGHRSK